MTSDPHTNEQPERVREERLTFLPIPAVAADTTLIANPYYYTLSPESGTIIVTYTAGAGTTTNAWYTIDSPSMQRIVTTGSDERREEALRAMQERQEAEQQRRAALEAEYHVRVQEQDRADARARALLLSVLSEKERRRLARTGYILVPSRLHPDCTYRIYGHRVSIYAKRTEVGWLCAQPMESIPLYDIMLMHKCYIEGDEQSYLNAANTWREHEDERYAWIEKR